MMMDFKCDDVYDFRYDGVRWTCKITIPMPKSVEESKIGEMKLWD